jgi:rubredoxin
MRYQCSICGFIYDEAKGLPDDGIPAGTTWDKLPDDWHCPVCGAPKSAFEPMEEKKVEKPVVKHSGGKMKEDGLRKLGDAELSAICTNLERGCRKQYRDKEADLFQKIGAYYTDRMERAENASLGTISSLLKEEAKGTAPAASDAANAVADRGAKRVLLWSSKVAAMLTAILGEYEQKGENLLAGTKIWVCDVCGFVYIGNQPPTICPVCKVPAMKILEVTK